MKSKTLDTALISLSVGCLVIGIYEVITRGFGFAYLWIMLSVILWLSYSIRQRRHKAEDASGSIKNKKQKSSAAGSVSSNKKAASKARPKRK